MNPSTTDQPAAVEQDWLFSFVDDHATHAGHFVVIRGTHDSARAEMVRRYGQEAWAMQYGPTLRGDLEDSGLTELLDDNEADTTPHLPALTAPLEAAGWVLDAVTEMASGRTEYGYLHPSGRAIEVSVADSGQDIRLTLSGLTLDQAVGAIVGAGYAPTVEVADAAPTEPTLRQALANKLRQIATDIVTRRLPVSKHANLGVGVLANRGDLDQWAAYLGSNVQVDSNRIPYVESTVRLTSKQYGPILHVGAQGPQEDRSEIEQLRARVAELEAERAGGAR